jgi:hypothetical protein
MIEDVGDNLTKSIEGISGGAQEDQLHRLQIPEYAITDLQKVDSPRKLFSGKST